MKTMPLAPGFTCEECGAAVTSKVLIEGERVPLGPGAWYTNNDRLTTNLPCGHDALATWTLDETAGMP